MKDRTLTLISPEWRHVFAEFVETGEAPQAFLEYLDQDERAQQAAELAAEEQLTRLRLLARRTLSG